MILHILRKPIILFLIALLTSFTSLAESGSIHYTIRFPEPHTHYVEVEMVIDKISQNTLEIKMPVWAPGSYKVREFSGNTEAVQATDEKGNKLDVKIKNKNTWLVNSKGKKKIEFKYRVYAYTLSVRTSFINSEYAYLNGTSIFMYEENMQNRKHTIAVVPHPNWKNISTGLKADKNSRWKLIADNYDVLVDCPIQIGNQYIFEFDAEGAKHFVAMVGEANYNEEKIKKDLATVTKVCKDVFKDLPLKEYTYIIHNTNQRGGGLEHRNSTSLQVDRWSYEPESNYLRFIGLAIHEYFHLWNVKRLRPEALGPFDFSIENYTTQLWVMEGITSYYDELLMLRGKFINDKVYLGKLSSSINRTENSPATDVQSLSEASLHSWIKYYNPNENSGNTNTSYYIKGSVVATMLDLLIRKETSGDKNLDDLMRAMYQKYYLKEQRGYRDHEFEAEASAICGKDISSFFKDFVYATTRFNYNEFLYPFGLKINNLNSTANKANLGVVTKMKAGNLIITNTSRNTAAYKAGLNVNDEIVSIDNYRTGNLRELNTLISRRNPGDKIEILIARNGKTMILPVTLEKDNTVNYIIEKLDSLTEEQQKLYDGWLK